MVVASSATSRGVAAAYRLAVEHDDPITLLLRSAAADARAVPPKRLVVPRGRDLEPRRVSAWLERNRVALVLILAHVLIATGLVLAVELTHR
jgi:hypothetical protein